MTRLLTSLGVTLCLFAAGLGAAGPTALAEPVSGIIQPIGSLPIPDGPAQAWIVADMDTGEVLAARDEYGQYAPASTIKVLLAMTV
ncbi:MAG: D-alanyl-D-alanine carboxypeptidase, partial [Mycobacterium sp.]